MSDQPTERTFEDLLADPFEQYDVNSECITAILASIAEYTAAPSNTASARPPRLRSVRLMTAQPGDQEGTTP